MGGLVQRWLPFALLPYGTMAVNITGCSFIGFLAGLGEARHVFSPEARLFVFIGILGGFTTFSTFALETLDLARDSDYARTLINVSAQVIFCLVAVWVGNALGRSL